MKRVSTVALVGALAGLFAAWVTVRFSIVVFNLHVAIWTFLLVWATLVGYFLHYRVPESVIGTGCYVIGISLFLKPPVAFIDQTGSTNATVGADVLVIHGVADLFISMLMFSLVGAAVLGVGLYFRRRGKRQRQRKIRASLRMMN